MDVARFCYTAPFRFFNDSPVTYPVQWYRAEKTAEFMPFFHAFGNSLYYTIEENQLGQLGEQPEQRTWNAGARIQTARGRHFCGTRTEWRDGLTYDPLAPPVTRRGDGLLTCCGMPPKGPCYTVQDHLASGYLFDGGTVFYTVPANVKTIRVKLVGGGGNGCYGPLWTPPPWAIGGAGGGGAFAMLTLSVTPGQTFTIHAQINYSPPSFGNGPDIWIDGGSGPIVAGAGRDRRVQMGIFRRSRRSSR